MSLELNQSGSMGNSYVIEAYSYARRSLPLPGSLKGSSMASPQTKKAIPEDGLFVSATPDQLWRIR